MEPLELEDLDGPPAEDPSVFDRVTAVPGELPTVVPGAPPPAPRPSERPTDAPASGVTASVEQPPQRETTPPLGTIPPLGSAPLQEPPSNRRENPTTDPPPVFGSPPAPGRRKRKSTRPPRPPSRPTLERAGRKPSTPRQHAVEIELELAEVTPTRPFEMRPAARLETLPSAPFETRPDALEAELPLMQPLPLGSSKPPPGDPEAVDMKDRYATGDFSGALVIAEGILEVQPGHEEALRCQARCTEVLSQMYLARLGSLHQVVQVALSAEQIRWLSLDHRAGFLLSLVDGISSIEELLDISSMPRLEALRILYGLLDQRVIALSG